MNDKTLRDYTRDQLLALTPARYLEDGFTDRSGKPRPELQTGYATAASLQLLAAQLSPQELGFTYEALRQTLPLHSGPAPQLIRAATQEALETVRGLIRQPNNPGLEKWLNECAASVKQPADLEAFLLHVQAVLRQYGVIAASQPA